MDDLMTFYKQLLTDFNGTKTSWGKLELLDWVKWRYTQHLEAKLQQLNKQNN